MLPSSSPAAAAAATGELMMKAHLVQQASRMLHLSTAFVAAQVCDLSRAPQPASRSKGGVSAEIRVNLPFVLTKLSRLCTHTASAQAGRSTGLQELAAILLLGCSQPPLFRLTAGTSKVQSV